MKRFVFCVLFLLCCFSMVYSQKKEEQSIIEQREEIFKYGLESEIIDLLNTLIKDEDTLFNKDIFDLFQKTKNVTVKEKIIDYFTVTENPILKDYVLTILEDPYDEKKSTVTLLLKYTSKLKLQEADPLVLELLKSENEDYIDICIETLGEIGNVDSALFLAEYLKTEDLSVGRKQALMKALGKLNAVETWDALVEIVQNEEENSFVRMYAAEALGNMKKEESIPILEELYSSSDANLRQYVLKGLKNFDTPEALAIILDGFKDNFYKFV
ncbi:MAG: HEAT repeat domain-containing protein [Spirochaetaceae bacterium]|nr:HEAT repeat domain-containing protein [Spirochaetaceae bacterium]